jgi:ABC-type bacteriocin/lantibiotic exporter with double-glycine peptidase domain
MFISTRDSFTSRNGTENWHLARALRKRGFAVRFAIESAPDKPWPFPAIAGVRLPASGNAGHFIVLLDRIGDKYVVGDPLEGRKVQSASELRDTYEFTGFFMLVN